MSDQPPAAASEHRSAALLLSERVLRVVDQAHDMAPSRKGDVAPTVDLEAALRLRAAVDGVVEAAVICARERGASWTDVADVLAVKRQTAHERWAPVEQAWRDGSIEQSEGQAGEGGREPGIRSYP